MKDIEQQIAPLVINQFPEFYKEEGPTFVAFVKAYYEWMEARESITFTPSDISNSNTSSSFIQVTNSPFSNGDVLTYQSHSYDTTLTGLVDGATYYAVHANTSGFAVSATQLGANVVISNPHPHPNVEHQFKGRGNPTYLARNLPSFRDIDTTLEDFIVHFKEKYLKNIQFDTATNKKLLVKHSLDLYRSKGTEQSIDLFFKLVYGTTAEVRYPGEKIFRVSDGIWERPQYLEITDSPYNVDYVGKQIIGARSGAKAFVERFIKRRTARGYVNILYISNIAGSFINNEVIGINVNNIPRFETNKRARMVGSIDKVTIINKGRDFAVGDLVSFKSSNRGSGGMARVAEVSNATGIIDFIFNDGGFGYTTRAQSLISEKVVSFENVVANTAGDKYFRLFEPLVEPVINISFSSATTTFQLGDNVYRYASNGAMVGHGRIIDTIQEGAGGDLTISHVSGTFVNSATYYTYGNVSSFYANTIEDRTIAGKVMGIPQTYTLSTNNQVGDISIGQYVYQANTEEVFARGTISNIAETQSGNVITIVDALGAFKKEALTIDGSTTTLNVASVSLTAGVYQIKKFVNTLQYTSANNDTIKDGSYIYQYNSFGNTVSKGLVLTTSYNAGSGNLTFVPLLGYFDETTQFYTQGNTAKATVVTYTTSNTGGDYIASQYGHMFTQLTNTHATPVSLSYGSGAGFGVSTIGDSEVIFIGTDLIGANNVGTLDYDRKILNVASATNFNIGDHVYQEASKVTINPSTALNAATGFIAIPNANTQFTVGDNLKYSVAAGNTAINGMVSGDYYHVRFANSTGIILSYPYRKTEYLNTALDSNFANNLVSQTGHYLFKPVYGTVFETAAGVLKVKDAFNYFGSTNTTAAFANSNVIVNSNNLVNTNITSVTVYPTLVVANHAFASLSIRDAAYGFQKNAQGEIKDTIYSCLTFDRFEIGTIGELSSINPGNDYTIDPYVLAYQPYISAFDRFDFVISIDNPTRSFVVGEKINQTLGVLVNYDLQVDSGVYGNTYNEITRTFNASMDVNGTTEFILIGSNTAAFNANTGVNSTDDFITISGNPFSDGDYIRYYTATGNTVISGLSNNTLYYVVGSNSSGIKLSTTSGGTVLPITASSTSETGHYIKNYVNPYQVNDRLLYTTTAGNTAIGGLSNNTPYYVAMANDVGIAVSTTKGGANVNITAGSNETHYFATIPGYLPGDQVYMNVLKTFNVNTAINNTSHAIMLTPQPYSVGDQVLYYTGTGNTAPSVLANNQYYYVVAANSTAIKLSSTVGGSALAIDATVVNESGHYLNALASAKVDSVYLSSGNQFVRVKDTTNHFANTYGLYSYTNPYVSATVSNVALYSITSTAKGIVKEGSNNSVLRVKRLTFENMFKPNELIVGDTSGAEATVLGVDEDQNELYPIGLNASIDANTSIANGQVASLQVIDSGFGYANSESVEFLSADKTRAGTAKVILDGSGIGKGYYRSSKGFLSDNIFIHDGDYYQEYSYEILSKMSVEKYADMFKKVMHVAGTKFFGSASLFDEANVMIQPLAFATGTQIGFNAKTNVSTAGHTIDVIVPKNPRGFNALGDVNMETEFFTIKNNPYLDGDMLLYTTATGNTVIDGMTNNGIYYVVLSNSAGIKISTTVGGIPLNVNTMNHVAEYGHNFINFEKEFSVGDEVLYTVAAGNTAVAANMHYTFNSQTNVASDGFISLSNNEITNGHYVYYDTTEPMIETYQRFNANTGINSNCVISIPGNPLSVGNKVRYYTEAGNTVITGLTNNQIYYIYAANSSSVTLSRSPDQVYTDVTNTNVFANGSVTTTTSGETFPTGLFFKPDGKRMFVVGQTIDRVNEYNLTTPWMVNTATFVTATTMSMETLYGETGMDDVYFTSNGTSMYVLGYSTDKVLQFELASAWTVNTAAYVANTSVAGQTSTARAMTFKPDGSRMYVVDTTSDRIYQYDLETPWDITSSIYRTNKDNFYGGDLGDGNAAGIAITSDGRKVILVGYDNDRISSLTLTTPWDISSASSDPEHKYLAAGSNSFGLFMKSDNRFYVADTQSDTIKEYDWTYMIPSLSETGHRLFRQYYYVVNGNTSGFQISYDAGGTPIDLTPSNTSQTQAFALKSLQDGMHYYVVESDHVFVKLALSPTGNVINITSSANSEVGHYLTKTIEEAI